ncbi:alkylation response protein AidB-like acyl-CoA dehydrogenase [Tamaricihabitans halophyticus]|uniref:Alkylation response protein AidB-like acyl-CoA dehydrogenase n=1 Tax=Tamaricihabitans halophyticus TaxID=1262583 RepID=A0A4R2Q9Y3_9PSEU|nr:acyl-CoA dehydrogenase family protein [Tamaricihabitans halophyticus]TCP45727.1 alkylation response protein AidB-like acyl-CoA dehydrogenase [Tamaricihabitans halophyticus]
MSAGLKLSDADERFRLRARAWLADNLAGEFADVVGTGGPGREHQAVRRRRQWERRLGASGWIGLGWPKRHGGQDASLLRQVVFHEEYARAGAPARLGHMSEQLVGPTLLTFGTAEQQARFLPGILRGEVLWCQGYSEPDAGSDLAGVRTSAVREGGHYVLSGQKIWTSLADIADWCFVLARTDPDQTRHRGLSYLLVPLDQPGIEIRPIRQITGTSEFNEVFFDGARTAVDNLVGAEGDGWRVAMGTLAFERGVATLGQQIGFERELNAIIATARATGAIDDPALHARIVDAWIGLRVMRYTALHTLSSAGTGPSGSEGSISKLQWANWHRNLGELAVDVTGAAGLVAGGASDELTEEQLLFLYTRADTIYGGTNEIQRNIVAERVLGMPR